MGDDRAISAIAPVFLCSTSFGKARLFSVLGKGMIFGAKHHVNRHGGFAPLVIFFRPVPH